MTASRWPMRWQRSSAWSCIAGVHSSSRNATFDARVSVMPWPADARRADDQLRAVRVLLERAHRRLARGCRVARRGGAARPGSARAPPPAPRGGARRRRAAPRRPGSRRSTPARRASLPRAASRCSVLSCASRSARSVAAIFASSSRELERLLAQPGDRRRSSASRYSSLVVERDRHDDLALGRQLRQHLALQAAHEAAAAQVPVHALLRSRARERAREARAGAEVLQPAEDAQLRDQLVGVVHHRRAGQREPQRVARQPLGELAAPPACAWPAGS